MKHPDTRRRRLLLWSALPSLLALAVAAKLLGAAWSGGQAADAFARNDAPAAASAAAALGAANFLERHKAPFAAGDALVLRGDFAGARTAFEAALADAPPADQCPVRVNLVLSIERLGDAAAAGDGADGAAAPGCTQKRWLWPGTRRPAVSKRARTRTDPASGCRRRNNGWQGRSNGSGTRRRPLPIPVRTAHRKRNRRRRTSRSSWSSSGTPENPPGRNATAACNGTTTSTAAAPARSRTSPGDLPLRENGTILE